MNLNFIFFPAPPCKYTASDLQGNLIWIPKPKEKKNIQQQQQLQQQQNQQAQQNPTTKYQDKFISQNDQPYLIKKFNNKLVTRPNSHFQQPKILDSMMQSVMNESQVDQINQDNLHNFNQKQQKDKQQLNIQTSIDKYQQNLNCMMDVEEFSTNQSDNITENQNTYNPSQVKNYISSNNKVSKEKTESIENKTNGKTIRSYSQYSKNKQEQQINPLLNKPLINHQTNTQHFSIDNHRTDIYNLCQKYQHQILQENINENQLLQGKNQQQKSQQHLKFSQLNSNNNIYDYFIPCYLHKSNVPSDKIMIYFHANGEDICTCFRFINYICQQIQIPILIIEYPGYGLYVGQTSDEQITLDAQTIINYLIKELQFKENNIIIFGRSIGTGPAVWLASQYNICALILISPFTSLRGVVKHVAGQWISYLVKERFENKNNIKNVKCPTFIVHGQKDQLIPFQQSIDLSDIIKKQCYLHLPESMDHIYLHYDKDFIIPLKKFFFEFEISLKPVKQQIGNYQQINQQIPFFPNMLFQQPQPFKEQK